MALAPRLVVLMGYRPKEMNILAPVLFRVSKFTILIAIARYTLVPQIRHVERGPRVALADLTGVDQTGVDLTGASLPGPV